MISMISFDNWKQFRMHTSPVNDLFQDLGLEDMHAKYPECLDFYRLHAAKMLNIHPDAVTAEQRRDAKAACLAATYGPWR